MCGRWEAESVARVCVTPESVFLNTSMAPGWCSIKYVPFLPPSPPKPIFLFVLKMESFYLTAHPQHKCRGLSPRLEFPIPLLPYDTVQMKNQLANSNYALLSHFFYFESIYTRWHQCPSPSQAWISIALPLTWTWTFTLGQGYVTPKQLLIHASPWPRWKLRFSVFSCGLPSLLTKLASLWRLQPTWREVYDSEEWWNQKKKFLGNKVKMKTCMRPVLIYCCFKLPHLGV